MHLNLARIHGTLNPTVLPSEELDELHLGQKQGVQKTIYRHLGDGDGPHRCDQLVENTHSFVSDGGETFLYTDGAAGDPAVEWPAD